MFLVKQVSKQKQTKAKKRKSKQSQFSSLYLLQAAELSISVISEKSVSAMGKLFPEDEESTNLLCFGLIYAHSMFLSSCTEFFALLHITLTWLKEAFTLRMFQPVEGLHNSGC